jgi:hypothetical protein
MTKRNTGKLIAGGVLLGEGIALAIYGRRYIRFMDRYGLMGTGKRILKKVNLQSRGVFVAIGLAEAAWGAALMSRAMH